MNPLLLLATAVAGGVGAGLRYLVDVGVTRIVGPRFPLGILLVNLTGSFVLGLLTGAADVIDDETLTILGIGLLGGYTTFSTVAVETVLLAERSRLRDAWLNAVGTAVGCVALAALGLALGSLR